jgi:formamidopyrimidine-DNA glycosylase
MPELPEVEMVARYLSALITGRTFVRAQLRRPALAPENSPRQFALWLKGARVGEVTRRGKHILMHFDNARTLITHLRMTGRFLYLGANEKDETHTHACFWLDNDQKLLFTDQRHFGMMLLIQRDELDICAPLRKLAPEPFSAEFTDEFLHGTLQRTRLPLKLALLDQTKVTGLGNIYAAEALHRAGINPRLPANRLSLVRAATLRREILSVLSEAINAGSTLNADPRDSDSSYTRGTYERSWRVYDREGQPCLKCLTPIRRFTQGARSTYYCPRCQSR